MLKKSPKSRLILVIIAGHLLLIGCGTKGPLYIPEQRYPQGAENNNNQPNKARQNITALQANNHAASKALN